MQKAVLLSIGLLLIITGFLSGCIDNIGNTASNTGTCCVLGIIGIVLFIILIAYLLGGKKTVVQTQQTTPVMSQPAPAPIIIQQEPKEASKKEVSKEDRRCPSCGRIIPVDAKMCPYCGKKFKTHFEEEQDREEPKAEVEKEEKTKKETKEKTKTPKHCPECGVKLEEGLDFCTNCGTKLR